MVSKVSLCLYLLSLITGTSGQNSSEIERISYLMEIFCPDNGICLSNRTVQIPQDENSRSCCSSCSCHEDCYLTNCCFPKLTNFEEIPESVKSPTVLHRTCISSLTTGFHKLLSEYVHSYKIVTSEAPDVSPEIDQRSRMSKSSSTAPSSGPSRRLLSLSDNEQSTRQLRNLPPTLANGQLAESVEICGDQVVAPWGSLYPVYSKEKDLIFKNYVCAEAYNVTDAVFWTPILICQQYVMNGEFLNDGPTFDINEDMNSLPENCFMLFEPPQYNLDSHICYIEDAFINTCPETDKMNLSPPYNAYSDEIKGACTSGILSPYKRGKMYANVFCFLCSGNYFQAPNDCPVPGSFLLSRTGPNMFGFIGLMDIDVLFSKDKPKPKPRMACVKSYIKADQDAECRALFCPSGKSRGLDGTCHFTAKEWFISEYSLMINISSNHGIDSHLLKNNDISPLKVNWPENWYVHHVLKETKHRNITTVSHLIITFKLRYISKDPEVIMLDIVEVMRQQFGLYKDGQFHQVVADFANFRNFLYSPIFIPSRVVKFYHSPNITDIVFPPAYQSIYVPKEWPLRPTPFFITKLHFCEQVELRQNEFVLKAVKSLHILYNKLTGNYLYDGEFTLVHKGEHIVPRVCLESSGLEKSAGNRIVSNSIIWLMVVSAMKIKYTP